MFTDWRRVALSRMDKAAVVTYTQRLACYHPVPFWMVQPYRMEGTIQCTMEASARPLEVWSHAVNVRRRNETFLYYFTTFLLFFFFTRSCFGLHSCSCYLHPCRTLWGHLDFGTTTLTESLTSPHGSETLFFIPPVVWTLYAEPPQSFTQDAKTAATFLLPVLGGGAI